MNVPFLYAFLSVSAVSLLSFTGIFTLALKESVLRSTIFVLVSASAGALFGDAFIHLIPEAFESSFSPTIISLCILAGILFFFILEKFLHWRHSHGLDEESAELLSEHDHSKKHIGTIVLVADGVHNLIDGVIIGASYLVSTEVGIATTIAVVLHEMPQEIGDFGLLLHAGHSKAKAFFYNFLSAISALVGVVAFFLLGASVENLIPLALSFAAGGFIYIAGSDLVPELQKTTELDRSIIQIASMVIGIVLMLGLLYFG